MVLPPAMLIRVSWRIRLSTPHHTELDVTLIRVRVTVRVRLSGDGAATCNAWNSPP